MKVTSVLFLLLLLTHFSEAQPYEWQILSRNQVLVAKSTRENLFDICLSDNQHGWAVGKNGTCVRTTDGVSWVVLETPVTQDFSSVFFVDNKTGWISGIEGTIIKTIDGGDSWTKQTVNTTKVISQLFFVSDSIGWAVGESGICFKTTDGGENWLPLDTDNTSNWRSLYFFDADTGYICGDNKKVKKTTDGGATWKKIDIGIYSFFSKTFLDIHFYNKNYGYIAAAGGELIYTSDGGKTWDSEGAFTDIGGYSVACPDSLKVFTVNGSTKAIYSSDGGINFEWQDVTNKQAPTLFAIYFTDTLHGWTVGAKGAIFYTIDGGKNWLASSNQFERGKIVGMHFTDNNHGWAATKGGFILETYDGGFNWREVYSEASFIQEFKIIDNKYFWATGPLDTIYYSNDTCKTWQKQATGLKTTGSIWDGWIMDLNMVDTLHGFAREPWKYFIFTNNGGKDWSLLNKDSIPMFPGKGFSFCNKDLGWGIKQGFWGYGKVDADTIVKTTDGGKKWVQAYVTPGISSDGIVFIDSLNGWFITFERLESGIFLQKVVHTNDGGATWKLQDANSAVMHSELNFANRNHGWSVTENSIIYTFDGGNNWQEDSLPAIDNFSYSFFLNEQTGWISGENGELFRTNPCFANSGEIVMSGDSVLCAGVDSLIFSVKARHKIYVGGESPDGPFGDYFFPKELKIRSGDTIDFKWVGTGSYNLKFPQFEKFNHLTKTSAPNSHQIIAIADTTISFSSDNQGGNMNGSIISNYKAAYDDFILVDNNTNRVVSFGKELTVSGGTNEGFYSVYSVNHDGLFSVEPGTSLPTENENNCYEISTAKEFVVETCASCQFTNLSIITGECNSREFWLTIDFDAVSPVGSSFVVFANGDSVTTFQYAQLPVEVGPFAGDRVTAWDISLFDSDNNNCKTQFNIGIVDCTTSANNFVKNETIIKSYFFQNENLRITFNSAIPNGQIKLFSLDGRVILSEIIYSNELEININTTKFKNGIYLLVFFSNEIVESKKVVKNNH